MGLWGDRTSKTVSNINYGLAFGMTFKMLLKEGNTARQIVNIGRHVTVFLITTSLIESGVSVSHSGKIPIFHFKLQNNFLLAFGRK